MNKKYIKTFLFFFIFLMAMELLEAFIMSLINSESFVFSLSLSTIIVRIIISIMAAVLLNIDRKKQERHENKETL